jgi:hypothetical protein
VVANQPTLRSPRSKRAEAAANYPALCTPRTGFGLGYGFALGTRRKQFQPKQISNNVLWLRADLGITLNDATITFPNAFGNGAWTKLGCTVGTDVTTDPFGGSTADSIIEDGSGPGAHGVRQAATNVVNGIPYVTTVYAKAATRSWMLMDVNDTNDTAYFDLINGVLGTVAGGATASITSAGSGWWKCSLTHSPTIGGTCVDCFASNGNGGVSYTGINGNTSIYLYTATASQPKVSAWADQSPSGFNVSQGAAGQQPLWIPSGQGAQNGQPALRFDGSDDELSRSATNLFAAGSYTLGLVYKQTSVATRQAILTNSDGVGGFTTGNVAAAPTNRDMGHIGTGDNTDSAATTSPEIWIWNYVAATSLSLRVNGAAQSLGALNNLNNGGGGASLIVGSYLSGGLRLGGDIQEIIGYSKSLSAIESNNLERYLRVRYAL